ncbi:hypothetical protein LIER_16504 [Lithospermum erythrorhizon]|uniref:Uncharacterized protein n=1 Tax=Lithospermum erythrorhizon TaxID=34254 RepID=A0AAV3Q779_LITER
MHNTSHSGYLTSFSAAKGCNIFVPKKLGKVAEVAGIANGAMCEAKPLFAKKKRKVSASKGTSGAPPPQSLEVTDVTENPLLMGESWIVNSEEPVDLLNEVTRDQVEGSDPAPKAKLGYSDLLTI